MLLQWKFCKHSIDQALNFISSLKTGKFKFGILSNSTIFQADTSPCSCFSIGPENKSGSLVFPSSVENMSERQLIGMKQTHLTTAVAFLKHLIPLLHCLVIAAVQSIPITVNVSSKLELIVASFLPSSISQLFPLIVEMCLK